MVFFAPLTRTKMVCRLNTSIRYFNGIIFAGGL